MGKGPKNSSQRAKTSKHMRGNSKKKRFKNESSEAQAKYKTKIAARRSKRMKRKK